MNEVLPGDESLQSHRAITELISEGEFLGTEFLTWLWWMCDKGGGLFSVSGIGDISIQFVTMVRLESGTHTNKETVQCLGRAAQDMKEARTGLLLGKKVARARLHIDTGTMVMEVTVSGKALDLHGLKIVRGYDDTMEEVTALEGQKGVVFLRLMAVKETRRIVHSVFNQFIVKRSDPTQWGLEKKGIREWILSLTP